MLGRDPLVAWGLVRLWQPDTGTDADGDAAVPWGFMQNKHAEMEIIELFSLSLNTPQLYPKMAKFSESEVIFYQN